VSRPATGNVDFALNAPSTARCVNADRIAGDPNGAYVGQPTNNRTPANGAYINDAGQFSFALPPASGRAMFFDFSQPKGLLPQPLLRNFTAAWGTEVGWLATPVNVGNGMWGMTGGQQTDGILKVNFQDATDAYRWTVRFNPSYGANATYLSITCTSALAAPCTAWTIEATGSQAAELIASTTSGKYVSYDEGAYVMPFQITITNP